MLKRILFFFAMLYAAASFAAVEVNKASAAELDGIKGIGPGISEKIVQERKKSNFKDWNDFISRVNGVGEVNAAKFSTNGLTVNGSAYSQSSAKKTGDKKPVAQAKSAAEEKSAATKK